MRKKEEGAIKEGTIFVFSNWCFFTWALLVLYIIIHQVLGLFLINLLAYKKKGYPLLKIICEDCCLIWMLYISFS